MFKKLWKSEKGFTLMELIIVIVILAILALIAIPRLIGFAETARKATDKEYAAVVARAAELHWAADSTVQSNNSVTITMLVDGMMVADSSEKLEYYGWGGISMGTVGSSWEGVAQVTLTHTDGDIMYNSIEGYYETSGDADFE